jgi:hypothetical protein
VTGGPPAAPSASPFKRRTLFILIAVGVLSLAVAIFLAVFSEDFSDKEPTVEANGYSTSAIGYEALIELLEEVEIPVIVSKHQSAKKAQHGLLVVFAPELIDEWTEVDVATMIREGRRVLVVLPRWWGSSDPYAPRWIEERLELTEEEAARVLDAVRVDGAIERGPAAIAPAPGWTLPDLPDPQRVVTDRLTADLRVAGGGVLLGHLKVDDDTEVWVLADPGPLENAGLRRHPNPRFAVQLIDRLRNGGPVVFDETTHGFAEAPSLWKKLIEFPLVLVSLHVLICVVMLLWAAVGRWGPARAVAPPLPSGKDFLIRNTADLLHVGGHDADALRRYLYTTIQQVRMSLHAPRELDPVALRTWLERVREQRGGKIVLPELERDVEDAARARRSGATSRRIVELAARIHRWRTEMTHGPHHHP